MKSILKDTSKSINQLDRTLYTNKLNTSLYNKLLREKKDNNNNNNNNRVDNSLLFIANKIDLDN